MQGYRDLAVWQRGMDLAAETYALTKVFPRDELFGLTSQARRAAASIPANIAEGWGRQTRPAYANHLRIAQGSLKELENPPASCGAHWPDFRNRNSSIAADRR
jgi:hypothetical protein